MNNLVIQARNRIDGLKIRVHDGKQWLLARSAPSVLPEALPFQDPIDQICEEEPPPHLQSTLYVIVAMFITLLVLSAVLHVDTVVVASGRLATDMPPILLQPMERSIIRNWRVKVGDHVTKGQVLATLDPTFTNADLASLSVQQKSVLAELRRLQAELDGKPFDVGGTLNADEQLQATLYRQRQDQLKSRLHGFDEDIERLNANIHTTEDDRASLAKQLEVARELESMRGALLASQNGSKLNYLDAQTLRMRTEHDWQNAANRLIELQHERQSKQAERQTFIDEWRRQLMESLVAARTESAKLGEGLAKASRMNDLVVVAAPADGVVLDVAQRSEGSVVREAEPLVTMIPSNAKLIAEIMIDSKDVGYTKAGDDVVVKIDAFPYQRHGLLHGRLLFVSEESSSSGIPQDSGLGSLNKTSSGAFHRGRVELDSTILESLPEGAQLIPGMTLGAEVKVGSRSVISYFLYPITRGLSEAIREP